MKRLRQPLSALGALMVILLSGCANPAGHEGWLQSQRVVESITSTQLPLRHIGDRPMWHFVATLTPAATIRDMQELAQAWTKRASKSELTLQRPATADQPAWVFTAKPATEQTEELWARFALLVGTWPSADVSLSGSATVRLPSCDPWEELGRSNIAKLVGVASFTFECGTGTAVALRRGSVPTTAHLTDLRNRARAVLSQVPQGTSWTVEADRPTGVLEIEVRTPDIPADPTPAVLAQQNVALTFTPTTAGGEVKVTVTGALDQRPVAREVAEWSWPTRVIVSPGTVELTGDLGQLPEVVPLAERHPRLSWQVSDSDVASRGNWVRGPGDQFGERARHYQALIDSGIEWTKIVLHHNQGRPTLSVEVDGPADWRVVVEAVRNVGWAGDLQVEIGLGYPQVVFTATATGPAREPILAGTRTAPDPERHPELVAIVDAWNATAA